MEYVAGKILDHLIPRRGLVLNEALQYAVEMAGALAAAHLAGIVHRDIKPSNMMVMDTGRSRCSTFGLAKLAETAAASENAPTTTLKPVTGDGVIVGTVSYMSPEQAQGKPLDSRSDIFSIGSVLYEMVSGRRAFQKNFRCRHSGGDPRTRDPGPLPPVVPHDLEKIIARCLRKNPARRFQTMSDLKLELEELKEESDSGRTITGVPAVEQTRPRQWPWALTTYRRAAGRTVRLAPVGLTLQPGCGLWRAQQPILGAKVNRRSRRTARKWHSSGTANNKGTTISTSSRSARRVLPSGSPRTCRQRAVRRGLRMNVGSHSPPRAT